MNGKIYLVGIGPGTADNITPRAVRSLSNASVIIGQKTSLDLIACLVIPDRGAGLFIGKEIIARDLSPLERSEIAVERALEGKNVAIATTGDPGIYAIASTFFGYLKGKGIRIQVEVIPGLAAANVAAALLGSPLGHDSASVSLGDSATPWEETKKRLKSAAGAGFVITLYNPKGQTGNGRLREAVTILMDCSKASTPVGVVTNASSEAENVQITTLGDLLNCHIESQTILIIGNSETYVFDGKMVTPRGYITGIGY